MILLCSSAIAAPVSGPFKITEAQLLAIAPGSKSCAGAKFAAECATAAQGIRALFKATISKLTIVDSCRCQTYQ